MHSEHGLGFSSELLEGVTSKGERHTDIYYEESMPSAEELLFYKSSFLIVMKDAKPVVYYVDQAGSVEPAALPDDARSLLGVLKKEKDKLSKSDFYFIPRAMIEYQDDIWSIFEKNKSDAKSAFVLHGSNLYFVDKLHHKINFIQKFNMTYLAAIDEKLAGKITAAAEQEQIAQHTLDGRQVAIIQGLIDQVKRPIIRPVHAKIPIDMFFAKDSYQVVQSALSPHVMRIEKQYYLYEAEVDPAQYVPNRGDLIAKDFETIREMKSKGTMDSLDELAKDVFDKQRINAKVDQVGRSIKKSVTSGGFWREVIGGLSGMATPHVKTDPFYLLEKSKDRAMGLMKTQHDKEVIAPRAGRAYLVDDKITIEQIRGGKLEYELKHSETANPFELMKVYVVSDVAPEVVASRGGLNSLLGRSFVCATEEDARELARKIQQNKVGFEQAMTAEVLQIEPFTGDEKCDASLQVYLFALDSVLSEKISAYSALISRQREYVRDYNNISAYDKGAPIQVEFGKKLHIPFKEYVHFKQIEDIQAQMIMVHSCIDEVRQDLTKIDMVMLNQEIKLLYDLCKRYIEQHPYKNKDTDPVYNLLHNMEVMKAAKVTSLKGVIEGGVVIPPDSALPTQNTPTSR